MNNLLINEPPLQVLPSLACAVGLNEAILLQQVHYWLRHAKVKHDDKMWIYKTVDKWKEQDFPFWSIDTIKRAISSLRKQEVLLVSKLASNSFNRVNHYSINYVKLDEISRKQAAILLNADKGNLHQSTVADYTEHQGILHQSDKGNLHQCLREYKENTKESNNNNNSENDLSVMGSIQDWNQPTLIDINQVVGINTPAMKPLDNSQYSNHLAKFKNYYAEQEAQGSRILTDNRRKDLLVEWIERDYHHQAAKLKAKSKPAAKGFNIDNEKWATTATTATSPVTANHSDSDLPDSYHPSHSKPVKQAKRDPKTSVMLNGLWMLPLPTMDVQQTYAFVKQQHSPGETEDETYDRLLNQLQGEL